ncbi:AAA family ATPase [Geminicoccus harenae]|uniref:bifunctional aminoglycoside phosphotransferase/ATP-binding protein n=2 Tax=Geminicoccus harenae TaxID=2498453 RepID=UPI0021036EC7|nr:bifunctional aminoglycoside phosphotransferase/ATP-binding protein [Geminicoccus harenae]
MSERDETVEVLAFLEGGGLGEPVQRVDTHGAHIFLGRELAWKMKRPVRFSFMDFSTLERRQAVIGRELELNRRTAPGIYRRVLPVMRRDDGRLALGGAGQPVEWLLEMARFPPDAQLDRMAEAGRLTPEIVERLARRVAAFHDEAAVVRDGGGHAALAEVVAGNSADLRGLPEGTVEPAQIDRLDRLSQVALEQHRQLLDRRRDEGRVRHCHGDLHLGNVVLLEGEPTPFDCLEFDPGLATIDVIYDLAFLVMDLLHRGLRPHAQRALQGWLEISEDDEAMALLPLCLATRAAVRAKVSGLQGEADEARHYLDLAVAMFDTTAPLLVALGGVSGTGKTTVARGLAPDLGRPPGAVILRSDVIRKRLFGVAPEEKLGAEAYQPEVSQRVFRRMAERAARLLSSGQAVIADGVFGDAWQRELMEAAADGKGAAFAGLWLEAPEAVLADRIAQRRNDASDATAAVLRDQLRAIDRTQITWTGVDASGDPRATLAAARGSLRTGG